MMRLSRQSGMTLVELMLAGALSVVISYFIMNIMITTARTASVSEGIAQAQETGRLVMAWLDDEITIGGYNSNYQSNVTLAPMPELCAPGAPVPPSDGAHCTFNTHTHLNGGDRIAIRRTTGGLNPTNRDLQNCGGEALPVAITNAQAAVIDVYWAEPNVNDADNTNDYQLRCVTYDENGVRLGNAQSIANGVESLHILIGIGDSSGNAQRFVSPELVPDWNNVIAVRLALLAREFGDSTFAPDTRVYGLLDADPIEYQDGVARYVQNGTIWFPNSKKM